MRNLGYRLMLTLRESTPPGQETVVFSCFKQDQPLDHVRFDGLRGRLSQNNVQEKLTKLWIDECLSRSGLRARTA